MIKLIKKILGIDEDYVSPIDRFLTELDEVYPKKSLSQQQDIKNAKRISYLRDHVVASTNKNKMWQDF